MISILLVEDDEKLSKLFYTVLSKQGFNIHIASNGIEGFDILENNHIDLIISDIMMPQMNGYDFTENVRKINEEIKELKDMSNSSLVNYTRLSPNCTKMTNKVNRKITIHHMACNISIEACGAGFADPGRGASSNYGIGTDGRIGLYVNESDRSWCSSNYQNDQQAVTIEVANDEIGGNWHVSDKAMASLINLCVDICKRNGIARLNFTGDASGNLTMHSYFAATACPGPYLKSKFQYIADEVNK